MPKRQKRVDPQKVAVQINDYRDRDLTFVLSDRRVVLGRIESVSDQTLTVRNKMRHKLILEFKMIQEIWMEEKVS